MQRGRTRSASAAAPQRGLPPAATRGAPACLSSWTAPLARPRSPARAPTRPSLPSSQILIDAVVHAVNKDYPGMAGDFIKLGFLAQGARPWPPSAGAAPFPPPRAAAMGAA